MNDNKLAGQVALITGGSGGIGFASAELLLREGAAVMLMGRRQHKLQASRDALLAVVPDGRVEIFVGDALDPEDAQRAIASTYKIGKRLDIVVSTVGGGGFRPLLMQDLDGLRKELDLNISSAFIAIRYSVPYMVEGGSIICISSTAGTMPFPWLSSYCAGKAGLEALVRSAADEMASTGVRINAVRPGLTRTDATGDMFASEAVMARFREQIPLARGGEPEDIAGAVRYLAGPESSWMTGQSFAVDGGQELRRHPDMTEVVASVYGEDALAAVQSGKSFPENTGPQASGDISS